VSEKVGISLIDDLDGSSADETVSFSVDGIAYEIDLSRENASKLRAALAKFIEAARDTGNRRRYGASRATVTDIEERLHNRSIRKWARQHGIQVSERGRLPARAREDYYRHR
jgi:hypothetical protein